MGSLKIGSVISGVSGKVGLVISRQVRGKTVVQNLPPKRRKLHKNQKPAVSRFKKTERYAKAQMKDPKRKALYKTGITDKKTSAHSVAASDYRNPPIIHYVKSTDYNGAIGSVITIKATDDFRVASVHISITDGNGTLLESGPAELYRLKPFIWKYKTTVLNPAVSKTVITATATDHATNAVSAQLSCPPAAHLAPGIDNGN